MSWIFPVFFGVLAAALLVYLVQTVRERMKPKEQITCTLESRRREKFPKQTVFGRRDKVDYIQVYRAQDGREITVSVKKAVYKSIPKEVEGVLTHRGGIFYAFTFADKTVTRNHTEAK